MIVGGVIVAVLHLIPRKTGPAATTH